MGVESIYIVNLLDSEGATQLGTIRNSDPGQEGHRPKLLAEKTNLIRMQMNNIGIHGLDLLGQ